MEGWKEPVGVYDSGVGGISVLRELVACMPQEHFLYFGDSANAPYGSRPTDEVRALAMDTAERLFARGCKALVVACNTVTAAAIEDLRARWPEKIIVGIEPALKLAVERHHGGRVAVLGTQVTIREQKFHALMERFRAESQVIALACPGLVEYIERGILDGPELEALLRQELAPALSAPLDAVVLGCTHYPFVAPVIRRLVGPEPEILQGGPGTARHTRRRLEAQGLLRTQGEGSVTLENSLGTPEILALSARLLDAE